MSKELLFSVTKKDFEITHIRGTGPGGQHKNKKRTGVRIKHKESGAVGQATEQRSQKQNQAAALYRLLETPEWLTWHRTEVARRVMDLDKAISDLMHPRNLKVEYGPFE